MEAIMTKILGIGALAALLLLPSPASAQAELWCVRQFGTPGPGICAFSSAHDCLRFMQTGGSGICGRAPLRGAKPSVDPRNRFYDHRRLSAW
jgi:hypothetical protein